MSGGLPQFGRHPWKLNEHPPTFRGFMLRAVDGDSYDMLVDQGFGTFNVRKIRLRGLDCPGTRRPEAEDDAEIARGIAAREFVRATVGDRPVLLRTYSDPQTFERFVADVAYLDDVGGWRDLAAVLRREGHTK